MIIYGEFKEPCDILETDTIQEQVKAFLGAVDKQVYSFLGVSVEFVVRDNG